MKINESVTWSNEQKQQPKQHEPADFSQWLQDASPTQQSSGDEYYLQHQSQLQHSDLHFDAKPIMSHHAKATRAGDVEPLFNTPSAQEIAEQNDLNYTFHDLIPTADTHLSSSSKLATILAELKQIIEQSRLPNTTGINKLTTNTHSQIKKTNPQNDWLNNSIQFKNNHLFIHGEQAELTLNAQQFNKEEQKELVQMIQDHLKKKGLVLSRLIINGVEQ